ncbi:MAG: deoxyribonuclease IV [Firmicutes bacterium]|nr:deoxyribonuclease IV [Bacillota bacterium]
MICLGAQLSHGPGYEATVSEAGLAGLCALQWFSRNPVGGRSALLPPAQGLRALLQAHQIQVVYIHAPYFVNPASLDPVKHERAINVLCQEMRRARRLSGRYLVLHPGHWQNGYERSEALKALKGTLAAMLQYPGQILLENTAGQGKELGASFEELASILTTIPQAKRRLGLMLDTAHAMAAGYPLASSQDVDALLHTVDHTVGLKAVRGIHLNDSGAPVGARRDRHAHLLSGPMTREALAALVRWADAAQVPLVLETPGRDVTQRQQDIAAVRAVFSEVL